MATTKIWDVRGWLGQVVHYVENPAKTENPIFTDADIQGLRDVMDYATQDYKTEMQYYVSSINCLPETARQQMMLTKKRWAKPTIKGLRALYFYYLYLLRKAQRQPAQQVSFLLREDIRIIDEFSVKTKLLCKYRIEKKEQLAGFISGLKKEKDIMVSERNTIGYRKRCETDAEKLEGHIEKIETITVKLSKIREELKLAESILVRSEIVQEKIEQLRAKELRKESQLPKQHTEHMITR